MDRSIRSEEPAGRWSASIDRLASIGSRPEMDPDELVRARTLVLATVLIMGLSCVWVVTYALLGLWIQAAIPLTYQLISLVALLIFARRGRLGPFRSLELAMMLVLPFLLQWSLGGFGASSVVALWAFIAPLGALMLLGLRGAATWFMAYLVLVAISWAVDPALGDGSSQVPETVRLAFFALNVAGVSLTAFLSLRYFVRQRDLAKEALDHEHRRSERLLLNVLPSSIALRLKDEQTVADRFDDATVLFADVVGFTPFAESLAPESVVSTLDEVFSAFDGLAESLGLEKIKTIGDAYMVAAGIPVPRPDHLEATVEMAIAMLQIIDRGPEGPHLRLRIGIATGPVVAGVIGRSRFIYDVWGDTVNMASRMEHHGVPDRIQVTRRVVEELSDAYVFESRGSIDIKGKGPMEAWLLVGRRQA